MKTIVRAWVRVLVAKEQERGAAWEAIVPILVTITTIEGGFVLTNSKYLYDLLVCLRAHGWAREIGEDSEIHNTHQNDEGIYRKTFFSSFQVIT